MPNVKRILPVIFCMVLFAYVPAAQITRVAGTRITVKNMDAAEHFYIGVLKCKKISDETFSGSTYDTLVGIPGLRLRIVRIAIGNESIELVNYVNFSGNCAIKKARLTGFPQLTVVTRDLKKAYRHLRKWKVNDTGMPVGDKAVFYIQDPERNILEVMSLPANPGKAKWPFAGRNFFVGIDHTSIAVRNADTSLHFYSGLLGMCPSVKQWAGTGLLSAARGPKIELLQAQLSYADDSIPEKIDAADCPDWQTSIFTEDAEGLYAKMKAGRANLISSRVVTIRHNGYITRAFMAMDPDGHTLLVNQRNYDNLPGYIRY